jgi:putative tricarboxylic transport membrane protein
MARPRRPAEVVAGSLLLALGIVVALLARRLPYWHDYAPGPGFFPLWIGALLAAVSAVELLRSMRRSPEEAATDGPSDEPGFTRTSAIVAGLSVVATLLVAPLGFILAMAVFIAGASWTLAPANPVRNLASTLIIPLSVWLIFVLWLGVPLPRGPLGF